jgi:glycosyltransferase involved in cell wall biosynthesis
MASVPELSVIVSTFERPGHLERCLASLGRQVGVEGRFEVIVTDDGSTDHTAEVVEQFAKQAPFAVRFVTQPHEGFQPGRARNNGVRASSAPYLVFTDGDCVLPPDYLQQHLAARRPGAAYCGDAVWLSEAASRDVTLAAIRSGKFLQAVSSAAHRRLRWRAFKSLAYQTLGHSHKPRTVACNMAVYRADFVAINGFDESFVGWGCEDDDVGIRLRRSGVRVRTSLHRTHAIHIWHPRHPTRSTKWTDGLNVQRLASKRLVRCVHGLVERDPADLSVRVVNHKCRWYHMAWPKGAGGQSRKECEVEIMVLPGAGAFSTHAELRVVVSETDDVPAEFARESDFILKLDPRELSADSLRQHVHRAVRAA